MMQQDHELHASIRSLIESYFSCLHRPVRKNLARLTCAFLYLAWSIRFGYGGLHLTSIARVLPEGKKFKSSYKWLDRKSTRLNSSHLVISYAVFCLKKKKK